MNDDKVQAALRYLRTCEHPITVRELASHLQVSRTTAGDYLSQLRRHGRAEVASRSGREQLWVARRHLSSVAEFDHEDRQVVGRDDEGAVAVSRHRERDHLAVRVVEE